MPLIESEGRGFILITFYRSIMRRKVRFIAYIIVSICCALLLTFTLGQNYDGKAQKIRGAQRRPVRHVEESSSGNPLKDPFVNRPRIQTRNGHLVIEASPDKNIDFKTSGSRGTITINGHKLDQLLDVTKALERSVLRNRPLDGDGGRGGSLFVSSGIPADDSNQFELVIRKILDSSDKLLKFERKFTSLEAQINDLTKQISKSTKKVSKLKDVLKKLGKKQEATEVKLRRNDCFNSETGQPMCKNGATCIDTYDGFKCLCTPQYEGSTCEDDVDECSKFRGTDLGCQNGAKCVNFAGGYSCECPPQYHGIHCTEQHDDCSLSTSRSLCGHGKCISLARNVPNQASYECACDQGWTTDGINPACVIDINECMVGQTTNISTTSGLQVSTAWSNSLMAAYPCSQNPFVECINLLGSFECGPCPPGYTGNGRVCRDVNECTTNNGGCSMSPLVECINTQGSHRCGSCPPGYTGDGINCWRTSPCDIEINGGCHPMAKCVELNGVSMSSRFCICNYPLIGDGLGPTGCVGPFTNQLGPTYSGDGAGNRNGNDSIIRQQAQQDDCNPNPCLNDSKCQKTDASFECICSIGWSGRLCDEISSICGGKYYVSQGGLTFPRDGSFAELIREAASEVTSGGGDMKTSSKSRDTNISKHYNCRWSISVSPSNMSIKLMLSNLMNINNSRNRVQYWLANSTTGHQIQVPSCSEYLDIREILDVADQKQTRSNRKLLAKICIDGRGGNLVSLPKRGRQELTLLSESNNAELEYSFSATRTQFGEPNLSFTLNWTKTDPPCGGNLDIADFGSISSPKFPDFYQAGTECRYLIHVPNNKRIRVQFGELNLLTARHPASSDNLEDDDQIRASCADSLTILDGSFGHDRPVLFRYCANNITLANKMQNLAPIVSSSSTIELILDSQPFSTEPLMRPKQKRGFYLTYASEPTTPGCGGLFTEKSAIIKSADYEADLSNSASAEDQRQVVQLSHYLENVDTIYSSSSSSSQSWYRPSLDSSSSVILRANSSEKFTGFKQTYKVRCEYEIRPANQGRNHKISIDWLEMPRRVPMDSNSLTLWSRKLRCSRNRLIVYDGNPLDNSNRTELATFCAGDKYNASSPLLMPIVTTGHALILVYETTNNPLAMDRNAQLLASAVGSNYPTGFKMRYSTVCTAVYNQIHGITNIQVDIDDEVSECIYHIVLPPNNTISLRINQDSSEMPKLTDGSCAAQAIFMDGAIQGGKLALIGAERQLKTYSYDPKMLDGLKGPSNLETRAGSGDTGSDIDAPIDAANSDTSNSYWQYSNSGQAHDIKEFEVCTLSNLNIDSVWNHLSLLIRQKQRYGQMGETSQASKTFVDDRPSTRNGKIKLTVSYHAEPSCGGIIDQPSEGSIKLESNRRLRTSSLSDRKYEQLRKRQFASNCSYVLKAPSSQQIQLKFDVPTKEIKKRFDDWLSWFKKQPAAQSKANTVGSSFNCAQVYEEVMELYEPSLNRTRYICPNDLDVMASTDSNRHDIVNQQSFWSTQSNIVYIRIRNSSEVYPLLNKTQSNTWPGKSVLNGSVITLNYKFVSGSSRQCGGRLIQDSGVITSPMFPYNYQSNANCVWIIKANPSQQIKLNFSKFEIEKQGACSFDYLELRNGPTSDSPLIGRFCNQDLQSRVIVSHSNYMWLKFKSDTSLNRPGFELYFDGAQTGCGGRLTSASGQIDSPNYPLPFAHSSDCKWSIEVVESSKIELTIQDLDLSSNLHDCRVNGTKTDYLEIFDSLSSVSEKSLGRFCHKTQLNKATIISSTNKLFLDFKSQALDNSRGFRITYKTFCNPIELTGFQGVIESPGYPTGYQAHSNCGWTIRAPLGSNLSIAIADLNIEDSSGDYVTVSTLTGISTRQNTSSSTYSMKNRCRDDFVEIYSIYPPALGINNTTKNITAIIESQQIILESRESKKFKSKIPKFGKLNNVLCGSLSNIPDNERIINLDTNLVHVNFESDRSVELTGFRIEWKAEGCGGVSEMKSDSVSSISYHEQMINQNKPTECLWTIDFPKQYGRIELSVDSDMRVPDASKGLLKDLCEDASLIVYDGMDDKSPILIKNCDSQNKRESVTSSTSQVLVKFFTSGQHNYGRGFVLEAYSTRRSSCLSNDFDLKSPFNQVAVIKKSPKYPDLYDPNPYNCFGLVTAQRNSRIEFNIDELDIPITDSNGENSETGIATTGSGLIDPLACKKSGNYLMIRTSMSKNVEEVYCGKLDKTKDKDLARSSVVFAEATVWEEFSNKGSLRGRWQISYTRLCGSLIWIEGQREFITPNYPLRPNWPKSDNEDELERSENVCIWSLKSRNNRGQGKLYLNIINFIESDNNERISTNTDCLRVYEGVELDLKRSQFNLTDIDLRLTPKLKICKQSDIKYSSLQYASQSNELYVIVSGNAIVKFQVKPFENGCGGEYHLRKSEFASLGYPQPYPELLDCHYFIKSTPGSRINLKFLAFSLPEGEATSGGDDSDNSDTKCDNVDYVEVRQISVAKKLNLKLNPIMGSFRLGIWSDLGFFLEQMNRRKNMTSIMKTPNINITSQQVLSQTLTTPKKQRLFDIAKTYYLFEELYNSELNSMRFSTIRTSFVSLDSFYENSKLIGRYCGNKKPNFNNISLFDEVLVRFRSHGILAPSEQLTSNKKSGDVAPKGFLAEYEIQYGGFIQVTDREAMDNGNFISSPSYPIKIKYNNSIKWTFETKLDSILQFDLINLDLGSSHLDCVDSLNIYDGLNVETSIRLSQACGHLKFKSLQYFRSRLQAKSTPISSPVSINVNALPIYEALDPRVRSSLIRSVRTSSNVATILYDNFKSEGSFLLRYKAINKVLAREQQRSTKNESQDSNIIDENDVILEERQDSVYNYTNIGTLKQNASKSCSNSYQLNIHDYSIGNSGKGQNKSINSSNQVTLLSPNYPNEPEQAVECHWLIFTQDDTVINLSIDLINLPNSNDDDRTPFDREDKDQCFDPTRNAGHQSYIVIHDGVSILSPITARFCLPAPPKQVGSSGRHMLIRYVHTKFSQISDGITTNPSVEPRNFLFRGRASVGQCGGQYHVAPFAQIPDRPPNSGQLFYANNLNCKYYIFAATQDKVLTIYNSQSEIDLAKEPTNENCTVGDYIEIRDLPIQSEVLEFSPQTSEKGRLLGRFCAGRKIETIESPGSAISIEFRTDSQNTAKGWMLGILSGDPYLTCPYGRKLIKFDEPFGLFTSPNWPHGLNRERHCNYGFEAPANQSILVTFIRLNRPSLVENTDTTKELVLKNSNNMCADNFDYLDDNEASLSYRFSNLRELNSPISGSLLRDHIQQVPCKYSPLKSEKLLKSDSIMTTSEESYISPEELSSLLKIDKPGIRKLTSDEYYQLIQKAPDKPFEIKTVSHTLIMDYQTKSLLPKQGFVAVYRTIDDRKFNCGGQLSYSEDLITADSKPSNYFESANFNRETQSTDDFIQCDWSIEAQPEKFSQYDRSLAVGISYSMIPTANLGNISNTYIVFQTLEIPPAKQDKSLFDDSLEPDEKEKLNEYCGLNRLILIDNWFAWPSLIACGNLTNARKWHMLSYGDRKLSIRTKNLRYKQESTSNNNNNNKFYRGIRGYLYEKNCLQVERIIGEGIRLRSNREFPNSSYTPGICRWRLRLDGGNYQLSFDKVKFRPPENFLNKTGMLCDANDPDLDYIEIRASDSSDSPILARYCIYNQMRDKEKALILNMESYLVITFVAGVKQLSLGAESFALPSPSSFSLPNQQPDTKNQIYGFDMEIVRISNETTNDFCRRDRRESIYWFIRSYSSYYYDTFMPFNINFLYPKNVNCFVDISVEDGMKFNLTFRGVFDIEPSKDCKNDYIQIDDIITNVETNFSTTTAAPEIASNKTHLAFKIPQEPTLKRIGRWCGRTKPNGFFLSTSNSIKITFHSNDRIEGKGFTLVYSRIDTSSNNTITDPKQNEFIYL